MLALLACAVLGLSTHSAVSAGDESYESADLIAFYSDSGKDVGFAAPEFTTDDGAILTLSDAGWRDDAKLGPIFEATYGGAALRGGCTVQITASPPYILLGFGTARAQMTVDAGCAGAQTFQHRLYRLNTIRGLTYQVTVAPGTWDFDDRKSACLSSATATWTNRVNGVIYTSASLACG